MFTVTLVLVRVCACSKVQIVPLSISYLKVSRTKMGPIGKGKPVMFGYLTGRGDEGRGIKSVIGDYTGRQHMVVRNSRTTVSEATLSLTGLRSWLCILQVQPLACPYNVAHHVSHIETKVPNTTLQAHSERYL
jgi:hypothetical protein